jgi:Domain of unknown function (DUF4265)
MKKNTSTGNTTRVKVYFDLPPDENGYPPAKSEFLWCIPTKRGSYLIDNIPFFVRDISMGDEISADNVGMVLHFAKLLKKSKNSTVRVLLKKPRRTAGLRKQLSVYGCGSELMDELSLLTVSMPPEADIAKALAFLDKEAERDTIGIEESSVRYQ